MLGNGAGGAAIPAPARRGGGSSGARDGSQEPASRQRANGEPRARTHGALRRGAHGQRLGNTGAIGHDHEQATAACRRAPLAAGGGGEGGGTGQSPRLGHREHSQQESALDAEPPSPQTLSLKGRRHAYGGKARTVWRSGVPEDRYLIRTSMQALLFDHARQQTNWPRQSSQQTQAMPWGNESSSLTISSQSSRHNVGVPHTRLNRIKVLLVFNLQR